MMKSMIFLAVAEISLLFTACDNNKPKPVSANITKTSVAVNGKKDSVLNNPLKNYGNATIAEPCIKCLISVIQNERDFKNMVSITPANNLIYTVNWVKTSEPENAMPGQKGTNGLRVELSDKGNHGHKLATYVYDNSSSELYFYKAPASHQKTKVNIASADLKRIRNSCYWGVSSN